MSLRLHLHATFLLENLHEESAVMMIRILFRKKGEKVSAIS